MSTANPEQVLFLCTGNFYRSRFAEIYFNHRALELQIPARAFSRGIEVHKGRNKGPISHYTLEYLEILNVPVATDWGYPVQLEELDFDRAAAIIALDETEHRPMLLRDFPHRENQVSFWNFPDIQFSDPALILPAIRLNVDMLLGI